MRSQSKSFHWKLMSNLKCLIQKLNFNTNFSPLRSNNEISLWKLRQQIGVWQEGERFLCGGILDILNIGCRSKNNSAAAQRVSLLLPLISCFYAKYFSPPFTERIEGRGERKLNFCGTKIKLPTSHSLGIEIIFTRIYSRLNYTLHLWSVVAVLRTIQDDWCFFFTSMLY